MIVSSNPKEKGMLVRIDDSHAIESTLVKRVTQDLMPTVGGVKRVTRIFFIGEYQEDYISTKRSFEEVVALLTSIPGN